MRTRRSRSGRVLPDRSLTSISNSSTIVGTPTKRTGRKANAKTISTATKSQSKRGRPKKINRLNKSVKESENEFATNDVSNIPTRKVITRSNRTTKCNNVAKTKKINVTKKAEVKETSVRQLSLKESFSNHIKNRLRPKRNTNTNKDLTSTKEESNKPKTPIYKRLKLNEESSPSRSDVYDFKFDVNDSTEHIKKKRKRVIKRTGQKKTVKAAKSTSKQQIVENKTGSGISVPKVESKTADKVRQEKDKILSTVETKQMKNQMENVQNTEKVQNIGKVQNMEQDIEKVNHVEMKVFAPDENEIQNVRVDKHASEVQNSEVNRDAFEMQNESTNYTSEAQNAKFNILKPKIISVQNLPNKTVVLHDINKSSSKNVKPFRPTDAFKRPTLQYKSMINDSLLNKSLSPISKAIESFDAGSPWRPPPLLTFSQVKDLVQSTPQPKLSTYHGRIVRNPRSRTLNFSDSSKRSDMLENSTENTNALKASNYNVNVKKQGTPIIRRFGTEITNLEKSNVSNVPNDEHEGTEQSRETKVEFPPTSMFNDEIDDKENTIPNKTPIRKVRFSKSGRTKPRSQNLLRLQKKTLTRNIENKDIQTEISTLSASNSSVDSFVNAQKEITEQLTNVQTKVEPDTKTISSETAVKITEQISEHDRTKAESSGVEILNVEEVSSDLSNENMEVIDPLDPKPGPSGLQKRQSILPKPLRQLNLNTFLNIPDMPERTSISTAHGIFDDAHSTPISGKAKKVIRKANSEVDNAFGFSDNDSDLDISPINPESSQDDEEKKTEEVKKATEEKKPSMVPARLSINEIKNNLLKKKIAARKEAEMKEEKKEENEKNINIIKPVITEKDKDKVRENVTKFSNTFDVFSDDSDEKAESEKKDEPLLFEDLEPSHFSQPPKRSYKRKRNLRFNFSESGSEDEERADRFPEHKKKKHDKLNKEDRKRLEEWVNNINKTFEEIDDYDLVVE